MSQFTALKSTTKSREHEFEADSDDLEDGISHSFPTFPPARTSPKPPTITLQGPDRNSFVQASPDESDHEDLDDLSYAPHPGALNSQIRLRGSPEPEQPLLRPLHTAAATFDAELQEFKQTKAGSFMSGVFNQANSIVGAGIVGLPYALQQAGFFTGLLLLLGLGAVTDWTIRLIAVNSKLAGGVSTYSDVAQVAFGRWGRLACSFFQFTFAFGGMAAFLVILGDTMPNVLSAIFPSVYDTPVGSIVFSRIVVVPIFTFAFCFPLSLLKDMHRLSAASGFALVQMAIILAVVVFHGPSLPPSLRGHGESRWTFIDSGVVGSIGVISFAYVCHHNSLMIFNSISTPTLDRFSSLTHYAVGFSVGASALMAVSGYLTFGQATLGNILNCFPTDDGWATIARLCFGLNMCTTFPLEAFVCREVIEQTFFRDSPESLGRHIAITSSLTVVTLFLALSTDDLGFVFEVTGGIGAAALAYVMPAACYLKLAPSMPDKERLAAKCCVGFGTAITVLVLFKTIWNAFA